MQINAEMDFSFCWERLHFLEQCYNASSSYFVFKSFPGKWESIKNIAWQSAFDQCEKEALLVAKVLFKQKLASKSNTSIDTVVSCDRQIHRKDYEKYLKAIQSHIHARLLIIESSQPKIPNLQLALAGTQKANFSIELTQKFWKINPKANYDQAYDGYLITCPPGKSLGRSTWEGLVRKYKLDPRPEDEKKRGNGKKTLQNRPTKK